MIVMMQLLAMVSGLLAVLTVGAAVADYVIQPCLERNKPSN